MCETTKVRNLWLVESWEVSKASQSEKCERQSDPLNTRCRGSESCCAAIPNRGFTIPFFAFSIGMHSVCRVPLAVGLYRKGLCSEMIGCCSVCTSCAFTGVVVHEITKTQNRLLWFRFRPTLFSFYGILERCATCDIQNKAFKKRYSERYSE